MMKQGIEVWIVIPGPIPVYPRLMPKLRTPLRARTYPQKMQTKTFYLVSVTDPEDGRRKIITVREPECWEAEVTVQVRRKT